LLSLLTAILTLAVPFLPQAEALCGGAAAAMVFRFWGDRHADVQQFQSLVDARAGGIADGVLIDAIRARGWTAQRLDGSIAIIRDQLDAGHPLILLIEDRPLRYHYVVAVGRDDEHVFVHDPTWGPARQLVVSELVRKWKPTGFWTLLVLPNEGVKSTSARDTLKGVPYDRTSTDNRDRNTSADDRSTLSGCDRLLDEALDKIEADGPGVADQALAAVITQCPGESAPLRELAGIRFAERRWSDAADLAQRALARNPEDAYAWDVLGSSRFVQDNPDAALHAWNHIDKPQLDSVQIAGLSRTRYAIVAQIAGATPNTLLTAQQLSMATRRLAELPDRVTTSVGYRPDADGFATLNVNIVERSRGPRTAGDWISLGLQAGINRELSVAVPGTTGQGEVWDANWRWWRGRPRIAAGFSAPRAGRLAGVWRVDGSWEAQTYGVSPSSIESIDVRQDQAHGAISYSTWLRPNLRFEASTGIDAWNGASASGLATRANASAASDQELRTVFVGGSIERRFAGDRVAISGGSTSWSPITDGRSFRATSLRGFARSSVEPAAFTVLAEARADFATVQAPLAIWPGAGDGRARPGLLRAHPLLDDGVINGAAFGRHVQSVTLEAQRWLDRWQIPRLGLAVFADAAHATNRLGDATGRPFQVDVGSGIRVRLPGSDRTFRFDYAHGLRDRRASAISVGIITPFN
jgi:peptidase C39-like protein